MLRTRNKALNLGILGTAIAPIICPPVNRCSPLHRAYKDGAHLRAGR